MSVSFWLSGLIPRPCSERGLLRTAIPVAQGSQRRSENSVDTRFDGEWRPGGPASIHPLRCSYSSVAWVEKGFFVFNLVLRFGFIDILDLGCSSGHLV
jgi:hypothetical protein